MYKALIKPILFRMEPESAHDLVMKLANAVSGSDSLMLLARMLYSYESSRLSQKIWGYNFRNPIGLAAGFDKNGKIPQIIQAAGFGFTEVGSITANPNPGNPRPRMFRLPLDRSLVNRMGLNNDGAKTIVKRLQNIDLDMPLGINIAKTPDPAVIGDKALEDYLFSYREAKKVADYITINISCPNTREGKTFEDPVFLHELLETLRIKNDARSTATLVKFSVDLERDRLIRLVEVCEQHRVHGYISANTSSNRNGLNTPANRISDIGDGGLSGSAIRDKSTQMIRWIYEVTKGQKTIIGVGGIDSFESALEKLQAGADLLQVYTGLVYEGPALVKRINKQLINYLDQQGLESLHQLRRNIPVIHPVES